MVSHFDPNSVDFVFFSWTNCFRVALRTMTFIGERVLLSDLMGSAWGLNKNQERATITNHPAGTLFIYWRWASSRGCGHWVVYYLAEPPDPSHQGPWGWRTGTGSDRHQRRAEGGCPGHLASPISSRLYAQLGHPSGALSSVAQKKKRINRRNLD